LDYEHPESLIFYFNLTFLHDPVLLGLLFFNLELSPPFVSSLTSLLAVSKAFFSLVICWQAYIEQLLMLPLCFFIASVEVDKVDCCCQA
jgi:hypothetical protein